MENVSAFKLLKAQSLEETSHYWNQRKLLFWSSEKVSCFREIMLSRHPEGHDIFPLFDYIRYIKHDLDV